MQYIFKAPKLERRKEWMTEIPDLATLSDKSKIRVAASRKKPPVAKQVEEVEFINLSQVNTQDNRFIWLT